eukprot:Skav213308  [mRNA]  locus=scaffold1383:37715:37954:- [translate_table: standard]
MLPVSDQPSGEVQEERHCCCQNSASAITHRTRATNLLSTALPSNYLQRHSSTDKRIISDPSSINMSACQEAHALDLEHA